MSDEKKWKVETSRGFSVTVQGAAPAVAEHGHLEFEDGSIFARNEWQFVVPA